MKFYLTGLAVIASLAMTGATAMAEHEFGSRTNRSRTGPPPITLDHGPEITRQAPPGRVIATLAQEIEQQACDLYYELVNPTFRQSIARDQLRQQAALLYYRAKRVRQTAGPYASIYGMQRDVARLDAQFHALNDLVVATIRQTRHQDGPNPEAAGHARLVLDAMDVTVHELRETTDQLVVAAPTPSWRVSPPTRVTSVRAPTTRVSRHSASSQHYSSVARRSSPWSNILFGGRGWSIRFGG